MIKMVLETQDLESIFAIRYYIKELRRELEESSRE
jgi:hypothetical protein